MTDNAPQAPAGWYPDADGSQRYWDGTTWLDIPAPPPQDSAQTAPTGSRGRGVKWLIAAAVLLVVLVGGGLTWKLISDEQAAAAAQAAFEEEREAAEKAEQEAAEKAERAVAAQEAADNAERKVRSMMIPDIESSIEKMATEHVKDDLIDGPVLEVGCSPVGGGSTDDLTAKTTVFECFVATKKNKDGTMSGYYYNATMNWDTGSYTYALGQP